MHDARRLAGAGLRAFSSLRDRSSTASGGRTRPTISVASAGSRTSSAASSAAPSARGCATPTTLARLVDTGVKSITLDETLKIGQLTDLGLRFRGFNPETLKTYSLGEAAVRAFHGAADALDLVPAKADPILRLFQPVEQSAGVSVSSVRVKVLNGSAVPNQAATVTQALSAVGFLTDSPDSAFISATTTVVRYAPGHEAQAQLVGRYIDAPVQFEIWTA